MTQPPPPTPPQPPTIGGYTAESLMQECTARAMARVQLQVASQGAKLSARERETMRAGIVVGAGVMFQLVGEIVRTEATS